MPKCNAIPANQDYGRLYRCKREAAYRNHYGQLRCFWHKDDGLVREALLLEARRLAGRIARDCNTTLDRIFAPSNLLQVVRVRRRIYKALRSIGMSYPAIGRFSRRDHSTVFYAVHGRKKSQK